MDRVEDFLERFSQVEQFLSEIVNSAKTPPFLQLVDEASKLNAAVRTNSEELKQFAKLRNAIVHYPGFPSQIIAVPSDEALARFTRISSAVLTPEPLMPTFKTDVHCFSPSDNLATALSLMKLRNFSQVVVRYEDGRLSMLSVEGITKWLADDSEGHRRLELEAGLHEVIAFEPPGCFEIMSPKKTVFDAADAFTNSIHREATRLYAIVITEGGGNKDKPVGFVTPWDLVHGLCPG